MSYADALVRSSQRRVTGSRFDATRIASDTILSMKFRVSAATRISPTVSNRKGVSSRRPIASKTLTRAYRCVSRRSRLKLPVVGTSSVEQVHACELGCTNWLRSDPRQSTPLRDTSRSDSADGRTEDRVIRPRERSAIATAWHASALPTGCPGSTSVSTVVVWP